VTSVPWGINPIAIRELVSRGMPELCETPPAPGFLSYDERTGGSVDYVLVMATEPVAALEDDEAAWVAAQLRHAYELIYVSQGRGFARLYRRRPDDLEEARRHARASLGRDDDPHP
jgi:hypothetical protein